MASSKQASLKQELSIPQFSRDAGFRQSDRGVGRRTGPPSGYLLWLGKSGSFNLDAQDRWLDGKRFRAGRQDRQAIISLSVEMELKRQKGQLTLLFDASNLASVNRGLSLQSRQCSSLSIFF